jgi:putative endonuclease
MKMYWVYILASDSGALYIGVTNDLLQRVAQHKAKLTPGFTAKYNCDRLVWYEPFQNVNEAIAAEKRLKGWRRSKKVALIVERNSNWSDLSILVGEVVPIDSEIPQVAKAPIGMTVSDVSAMQGAH